MGDGPDQANETAERQAPAPLRIAQLGLNSSDLAGSARLYSELFGYANGGANMLWGEAMRIQGLGPEARCLIWWLVSGEPFFQLEFFHHSRPAQRPQPADWTPRDHGWVRFGLAAADFDRLLRGLRSWDIPVLGTRGAPGERRLAFRDPFAGVIVDVAEAEGAGGPVALTYAACSVADLDRTRRFYETLTGGARAFEPLGPAEAEGLWGQDGAQRSGFVVPFANARVEIVRYETPAGRPKPSDWRVSDQGFVNIALGSRDAQAMAGVIDAVGAAGFTRTAVLQQGGVGTYVVDPGCEVELIGMPEALDGVLGFLPAAPFFGAPAEPH